MKKLLLTMLLLVGVGAMLSPALAVELTIGGKTVTGSGKYTGAALKAGKVSYTRNSLTLENAQIARSLGFGGIVVCGDLWNRFDIHNELDFKAIIGYFNKLREAIE